MDNPAAHFTKFMPRCIACSETLAVTRIANGCRRFFLISENLREPSAEFFLSCTKNIELTRNHFDLTFSFAHTKISSASQLRRTALKDGHSQEHQPYLLGQHAMKLVEWKTYRTRFLVKAKQLGSNLSFTDHLGRQHCGRKGDYLVESSDGVLSIAPRQIFEDIYVSMSASPDPSDGHTDESDNPLRRNLRFEPLTIEKMKNGFGSEPQRLINVERMPRIRKSPQPVRVTGSRLGLM